MARIGYLGPKGTYSYQATQLLQLPSKDLVPCDSIGQVIKDVVTGEVEYGLVPVENSLSGVIPVTLDMVGELNANIIAEITLDIRHKLLSKSPVSLTEVTEVWSHPQPLLQCRQFIDDKLKGAKTISVSSTAQAVENLDGKAGQVVIGGEYLQQEYGLIEIVSDLVPEGKCKTRFWLLGHGNDDFGLVKGYRTCIRLDIIDKIGSLAEVLNIFAKHQINLYSLQSRPSEKKLGHYYFYIELDIDKRDGKFVQCCLDLQRYVEEIKVYGTYKLL